MRAGRLLARPVYRQIQGRYPVAIAFWIGWLMASELARRLLFQAGGVAIESMKLEFAHEHLFVALLHVLSLAVFGLGALGAWRSVSRGDRSPERSLQRVLIRLAILGIVALTLVATLRQAGPYGGLIESVNLGSGEYPERAAALERDLDRNELWIRGPLGEGTARMFANLARRVEAPQTVVLSSPGGSLREARQVAAVIEAHRWDTRVEGRCLSACVLVLLAGESREAAPRAHIGVHQATAVGSTEVSPRGNATIRSEYLRRGVAEEFVERALQVPPTQVWYPTGNELYRAGVLTRFVQLDRHRVGSVEPVPVDVRPTLDVLPSWADRWWESPRGR